MKKYVIGVDGGGTKTHCALFDLEGNRVDILEWGTTNHEALRGGYEELKVELGKVLNGLLVKNNIGVHDLHRSVFGMAGVDTEYQHKKISSIIKELGIQDFILCNDSFLGIKAGCKNGYGICAINGTGFSVTGIDTKGNMLQIGGQGEWTGDIGGGGYLTVAVIRSVYDYLFKGRDKTIMVEMLFNELQVTSRQDFMNTVSLRMQYDEKSLSKKVCMILYEAANCYDAVALRLLEIMGIEYGRCIGIILEELDFKVANKVEIVLAGSQFVKGENPHAIEIIKESLNEKKYGFELDVKLLSRPCVAGAVVWALEDELEKEVLYTKVIDGV